MEVLAAGKGEFKPPDPDGMREWVRHHKKRALVSKVMTEQEAVSRFVSDGDYLAYDLNIAARGPHPCFVRSSASARRTCGSQPNSVGRTQPYWWRVAA